MADWFETRFREPVGGDGVDPDFVERVRASVVEEWRAGEVSTPSRETDTDHDRGDDIVLETKDPKTGASPADRTRATRTLWFRAAAVALVGAIAGGAYLAGDDDEEVDAASPAPPAATDVLSVQGELDPGVYSIDPDGDPGTPLQVTFTVTGEGWEPWFGASKFGSSTLSITSVSNLVADGCLGDAPADPPVGPSVDDLATALAALGPFEVSSPPTDVVVDGYAGTHLALRVPDLPASATGFEGCDDGRLRSWISPLNGDGPDDPDGGVFSGYDGDDVEEFWILDVEGTRLVIQTWRSASSAPTDADELQAMVDSIQIFP